MSTGDVDNSHNPLDSELGYIIKVEIPLLDNYQFCFLGDTSLTFSSAAFISTTPFRDRLSTPPRTSARITGNLGRQPWITMEKLIKKNFFDSSKHN